MVGDLRQSSIVSVYVNSDRLREAADVAEETLRKIRKRPSTRLLKCWEPLGGPLKGLLRAF